MGKTKTSVWRRLGLWSALALLLCSLSGCGQIDQEEIEQAQVSAGPDEEAKGEEPKEQETLQPVSSPKPQDSAAASASPKETEAVAETGRKSAVTGALSVQGTQLVDAQGNPVQLKGISTHGLSWFPEYVNEACFRQLKEEWQADVIRLAMYTGEGGYCTGADKESLKSLVKNGVEYATSCGLYVIIDWHILSDGNPNTYLEESKAFFSEMSREYASYTNVLYEICNEPNGGTSWQDVKSYAEQVIPVIRENDEDGIILVGTPNWCQFVDQAAADPLTGYENVMYTLHFYAATHKDSLRNTMVSAIQAGLPIFVSEYGICDASGNGALDIEQANRWVSLMDQYGVSYVAWNLANKAESSSLLKSSCSKVSGFSQEDLSDSGNWLFEMLTGSAAGPVGAAYGGGQEQTDKQAVGGGAGSAADSGGNASAQVAGGAENVTASAEVTNSWEQNGETCRQYVVTLKNTGAADANGWKVELHFSAGIALENGWNGTYQVDGSTLTITPAEYNAVIAAGGSVGDIGFILRGAGELAE